jgi:hypothetical protein
MGWEEGTKESSHRVGWNRGSLTYRGYCVEGRDGETEASGPCIRGPYCPTSPL